MKKVILQGHLGDKYGHTWNIKAQGYQDVFGCIEANYPGFRQDLIDLAHAGGDLDIQQGETFLEAEELFYPIDNSDTIIITPIPAGAKSGGAKILAAVALVAIAFLVAPVGASLAALAAGTWGWTAAALLVTFGIAANLALAGLEQLLAPDPSTDEEDRDYLFKAPANTIARGNPVPVLFGELIVGGVVISSGIGPDGSKRYGHTGTRSSVPINPVGFTGGSRYVSDLIDELERYGFIIEIDPFGFPTNTPDFTADNRDNTFDVSLGDR